MESGRSRTPVSPATSATSVTSRREVHGSGRTRGRRTVEPTWAPRAAVLAALATATIAVPLVEAAAPPTAAATAMAALAAGYPTAYQVLTDDTIDQMTPTSLLAAVRGAERVSDTVSRSLDRDPLPGCDGQPRYGASNGVIPETDLCLLWDGVQMLRGDAAVALAELNLNFRAAWGRDLCITDSYRTLSEQRHLAATKGGLAATPGTSNHGWGLAVDLCSAETHSSAVMAWLTDNGPTFGWVNPAWAQRSGSGPYEPWHWEYLQGTIEMGTDYSD